MVFKFFQILAIRVRVDIYYYLLLISQVQFSLKKKGQLWWMVPRTWPFTGDVTTIWAGSNDYVVLRTRNSNCNWFDPDMLKRENDYSGRVKFKINNSKLVKLEDFFTKSWPLSTWMTSKNQLLEIPKIFSENIDTIFNVVNLFVKCLNM